MDNKQDPKGPVTPGTTKTSENSPPAAGAKTQAAAAGTVNTAPQAPAAGNANTAPQAPAAEGSNSKPAGDGREVILIIDNDPPAQTLIKETMKVYEANYNIVIKNTFAEGMEVLNSAKIKITLIEISLIDHEFLVWYEEFKKDAKIKQNAQAPVILLSFKDDVARVRKMLQGGVADYIVKPIDRPLFMQKMSLHIDGKMVKQLYTYQTSTPVDLSYQATIEELSEFGITIRFERKMEVGDVTVFYSDIFKTGGKNEAIGRCYQAMEHPENKQEFLLSFMFVGISQDTLRQIRSWLRAEYVRKKQQAG